MFLTPIDRKHDPVLFIQQHHHAATLGAHNHSYAVFPRTHIELAVQLRKRHSLHVLYVR